MAPVRHVLQAAILDSSTDLATDRVTLGKPSGVA